MSDTSLFALSASTILSMSMDVVAGNIANSDTPGYKREAINFDDYVERIGADDPPTEPMVYRDYVDGNVSYTSNPLDLAIEGEGFYEIEIGDQRLYTRAGHFRIDVDGNLVTAAGARVLGDDGGPIVFAPTDTDIVVDPEGNVFVNGGGSIGRIGLVEFADPQALQRAGDGMYIATGQTAAPATDARIAQGAIEKSNVVAIREVTLMMNTLRAFQSVQKVAEGEHERIRRALQTLAQTV